MLEIDDEQNTLTETNTELRIRLGLLDKDLVQSSLLSYFNITLTQSPIVVPFKE